MFRVHLLSCVDIEEDLTFGLPECVCYNEEFVTWRLLYPGSFPFHFTVTLVGQRNIVRYIGTSLNRGLLNQASTVLIFPS